MNSKNEHTETHKIH